MAEPIQDHEIISLPQHQVSFQFQGIEKTRWHFGSEYPRPFFYPMKGPAGTSLTRMGHPGAANHDHHRSIWFAHHRVNGVDFWSDTTKSQIRQKTWLSYVDGESESIMASLLGWFDEAGTEVMEQEVVAALMNLEGEEHALELQLTFRVPTSGEVVELGKTNFGFLAVRVAKSVSEYFGGGTLTNSHGDRTEAGLFGKSAKWVDYSGPVSSGRAADRKVVTEGITYFDHPENPRYPSKWHVRQDGWMGASFCFDEGYIIAPDEPLVLRYLLHVHQGAYDPERAESVHAAFVDRPGFQVQKRTKPHGQFDVSRRLPEEIESAK